MGIESIDELLAAAVEARLIAQEIVARCLIEIDAHSDRIDELLTARRDGWIPPDLMA